MAQKSDDTAPTLERQQEWKEVHEYSMLCLHSVTRYWVPRTLLGPEILLGAK